MEAEEELDFLVPDEGADRPHVAGPAFGRSEDKEDLGGDFEGGLVFTGRRMPPGKSNLRLAWRIAEKRKLPQRERHIRYRFRF